MLRNESKLFNNSRVKVIFSCSPACVQLTYPQRTNFLQVTCKPMAGLIQERMKRLQESTVSDNVVLHALGNIGLGNHGILFQRFYPQKLNCN